MIHIQTESPTFMPDYESYNLSIDYINLIPLDPAVLSQCQPEDYAALTEDYNLEFGELMLDDFYNYQFQDVDWQHSLLRAYNDDDISDLQLNTIKPIVLPRFRANFQLREYSHTLKHGPSARFTKWVEQNEQELTAKGYIPGTPSCTVGNLPLGKLVGDPWEEFQKLQTYPRICRTSITKTE